ncbi:hypothetical protein [Leptospira brenneri]|uniref:Uncharacterized protein n=1 Tax=Leptospira brenneri TaxID=2023182 RepID=A0A2M9XZT5_9LEPT|nr:hypothetical protein [Leptospira brenneri]PJZ44821.1 hypothetical protein CH361_14370 [Leptospira brenneri]TGK97066.1 hypothetical protein EHQ30_10895 [Leptospira brenneri]
MPLSQEQIMELSKLQKMLKNLEKIERNAKNDLQKERVAFDIERYRRRMQEVSPEGIPDNLEQTMRNAKTREENPENLKHKIISQYPVMKVSPNSNDSEINQIGTLVNIMDLEYIPILGDGHIKFDYSHATERDSVLKYMENLRRNMKILVETVEEYAAADKQEFREQLSRMKNKQSRIFIAESFETLGKFRDFLTAVNRDIKEGVNVIMNMEEPIKFNPRFEKATVLEGRSIMEGLREFQEFAEEACDLIRLPSFRG